MEGNQSSKFYPNEALIVHEDNPVERKILDILQARERQGHGEYFKFRHLSRELIDQFSYNDQEFINPIVRAGQIVMLPNFRQPDPYFWEIYENETKFYGGMDSDFKLLDVELAQEQQQEFSNFNTKVVKKVEFNSAHLDKFMIDACLRKMDVGESEFVSTVWRYN
jgi:hypothetical protein